MTRVVLGTGDHVYELINPFGDASAGLDLGSASHVATDSADRVYVFRRDDPPVVVLDSDGNLLRTWGQGQFVDPHGIYVTPSDEIYLVDRDAHEVLKLDTEGRVLLRLGTRERPSWGAPFNHPADVAVAPDGDILVADGYGNSRVHRFTPEGVLIRSWGVPGDGRGAFTTPHGVWAGGDGRVYVCDRENNRVQVFTPDGDYVTEWRDLFHPMDVIADADGNLYVSDQIPRITVLDADGNLVARARTPFFGHGIWMDSRGDIYIADPSEGVAKLVKRRP